MPPRDALAALNDAVQDQAAEAECVKKLQAARAAFILGKKAHDDPQGAAVYAFYASLVLKFRLERKDEVQTMATDGRTIWWALPYVAPLTPHQCLSELAHETSHAMLQHQARMLGLLCGDMKKLKRAQVAADCAVDPMMRDAGFWNPDFAVFPKAYDLPEGLSFEEYYARLPADAGQGQDGQAAMHGQVMAATGEDGQPDQAAAEAQGAEWRVAIEQARRAAKMRGTLPGYLDELCDAVLKQRVDWRVVLREFFNVIARDDYTWSPPNRRYIADGIYLPSCRSERLGRLVIVCDTSGSMSEGAVAAGFGEVAAVLAEKPMAIDLLLHDSKLYGTHRIDLEAGDTFPAIKTKRGGTSHLEAFRWVQDNAEDLVAVLVFSDCESDLDSCPVPVFFFKPTGCRAPAPTWGAASCELPDA